MALKSRLALWCYSAPTLSGGPTGSHNYAEELEDLYFTTVAPGGYGELRATLKIKDARLPRPELALFSKVALMAGDTCIWSGEITAPTILIDSGGESVRISALGISNVLRDDPIGGVIYTNQTAQAIILDQIQTRRLTSTHALTGIIDADMSAVFPDNPATQRSPAYVGATIEDILNDQIVLAGDYTWAVWVHPSWQQGNSAHADGAGFPLGQVQVHTRDTSTTSWQAGFSTREIIQAQIAYTADRAYGAVEVDYSLASSGIGNAIYTDARLAGNHSQGTAPFRWRKYLRNLTGLATVSATDATTIANTYGAQMQNPLGKTTLSLRGIRDANGNSAELWMPRADSNIACPEVATRGATLPTALTAGTNQFYILQTAYREDQTGSQLDLTCDNWYDSAATLIGRLQSRADAEARAGGVTTGLVVALGAPVSGFWGFGSSNATAGQSIGSGVQFPGQLSRAPTSLTLTTTATNNLGAISQSGLSINGAYLSAAAVANGAANAFGSYVTVGNCLRAIWHEQGRFDWHCDACDQVHEGLHMSEHLHVSTLLGADPGVAGLAIVCPTCAAGLQTEVFNTGLSAADEDADAPGNYAHRAEQARLIRQLQAHPLVGLRLR